MPKQTIQSQLIEGLLALGYVEVHPPRKYRIFSNPKHPKHADGQVRYVFVGSNGALRVGKSGTQSRSCSDVVRLYVLEAAPKRTASQAQQAQAFADL